MTGQTTFGTLHSGRIGSLTNADPERELMMAVNGETVKVETQEEYLARAIYEHGHADNTIEVWRKGKDLRDWRGLSLIVIRCGHCNRETSADVNSGWFCCRWAGEMYTKYFEHNLVKR